MKETERRNFLGGTDAAAVLGVSSWTSPVELYLEKIGKSKRVVTEAQRRMWKRGQRLEPFIRQMTLEKLADEGHDVELVACNERYTDAKYPFLRAEIDFEIRLDGEHVNVDAKSVSGFARNKWGEVGSDQMPIEYAAQFMAGMGVHPLRPRRTLVAALRSFDDCDIFWLPRDDETIAGMRDKMVSFWVDHVVPKVPPDPASFADVRHLFPKAKPKSIEATPEIMAATARLQAIRIDAAKLDAEKDDLQRQIGEFMGQNSLLTNGVRDVLEWSEQITKRFDLDAFKRDHADWIALYTRTTKGRVMRQAKKRG